MKKGKIAVFGASGLVGARLCESLYLNRSYAFKALIHSPGNAYRIAKYPMEIEQVNLLDKKEVYRALDGCSTIVNCSRGDDIVMVQGLKNLINGAMKRNVEKIIHLSSVLIYGEHPPPESHSEELVPDPGSNRYGQIKLKQDNLLLKYKEAFSSIILCPPNIHGPYTPFGLAVLNQLKTGKIVLVDGGKTPCNVVHVDNLVLAIYRAMEIDGLNGERFFVRDAGEPTWVDYLTEFADILGIKVQTVSIDGSNLTGDAEKHGKSLVGLTGDSFKYLVSSDFRKALSGMPLLGNLNNCLSSRFNSMNPRFQEFVREKLDAPVVIPKEPQEYGKKDMLIGLQMRKVRHSIQKAERLLDYKPMMDYKGALENTKTWLEFIGYE